MKIVAIDGPVASGKSTVGRLLARELGYGFLDTGMLYRAVTLRCLVSGIDLADSAAVAGSCRQASLEWKDEREGGRIFLDGRDVTERLHRPDVAANIRPIADLPDVREVLVALQRKIGSERPTVAVGRDMCTIVFPDARHQFYLDASEAIRAERRILELERAGVPVDPVEQVEAIRRRDEEDKSRAVAPLKVGEHAEVIDTSEQTTAQVVSLLAGKVRGPQDRGQPK